MPGIEHKISLNEEQLAKLNAAKEWAKNNWKPFVAGSATMILVLVMFKGRSASPVTIINNIQPMNSPENPGLY